LGGDEPVLLLNPPTAAGTTATERTGDGTTTAFTFTGYNGTAVGGYIVSVGGIDQPPSKYSISSTAGGTVTFVEAPTAGELISIRALVASSGGGGGSGDATSIQGLNVTTTQPLDAQVLVWSQGSNKIIWTTINALLSSYSALFESNSSASLSNSFGLTDGDFTAEFFINRQSNGAEGHIFCDQPGGLVCYSISSTVFFGQTGAITFASGTLPIDNDWHHVALVREAGEYGLYVGGVRVDNGTNSANLTTSGPAVISALYNLQLPFQGKLASLRISNNARYSGVSLTVPTAKFTEDANTLHLFLQNLELENSLTTNGTVTMVQGPF
jgi:hypothetical protein